MAPLPHINAMQFQGEEFSETLAFAQLFAGIDGHIATMPEIITARANAPLDSLVWSRYYTTVSSEFFGLSRSGSEIVVVAHGSGPLQNIAGLNIAYSPIYGRGQDDGYITPKMLRSLENGDYGEVEIVDFASVQQVYEHSWSRHQFATMEHAAQDPLLKARCGPDWLAVLEKLHHATRQDFGGIDDKILTAENGVPYGYWHSEHRQSMAIGNLLSTSSVCNMHAAGQKFVNFSVKTHGRTDSTRFVGIRQGADLAELHRGPELLHDHTEQLLRPYDRQTVLPRLMTLKQFESGWFSCRPKEGNSVDTGWPEHPVIGDVTLLGKPGKVTAPYSPFFKYDVAAVIWEAPDEANAYYLGEPQRTTIDGSPVIEALVHYCRVEVDTTKMCVTKEELDGNFELQMLLLEQFQ